MLNGLDISHHNTINAQVLRDMSWKNRLYFNFIKASEGATIQDGQFASNWQLSRDAGLICGAYHFLRPFSDPLQQADNFISQYKKVSRVGVFPPVVDIEWAQSSKGEQWSQLTPAKRLTQIKAFMAAVEHALNVQPIIYTAVNFWNTYVFPQCSNVDNEYFKQHMAWIVNLNGKGAIPKPWSSATFWQMHFGENGTGNDPYAHLDQDVFNGSLLEMLNSTLPGFTVMNGFPRSYVVYDMQDVLKTKGFIADEPDGYFGKNTETAVVKFQQANGLTGNGIVDRQTWNKLLM
ncbi:MAG: peptidoglycan-binding protein [Chitinophagaceae bacterium]|nr:peptidoglycan-binding protein [Chitinophagaceae bacterium]